VWTRTPRGAMLGGRRRPFALSRSGDDLARGGVGPVQTPFEGINSLAGTGSRAVAQAPVGPRDFASSARHWGVACGRAASPLLLLTFPLFRVPRFYPHHDVGFFNYQVNLLENCTITFDLRLFPSNLSPSMRRPRGDPSNICHWRAFTKGTEIAS